MNQVKHRYAQKRPNLHEECKVIHLTIFDGLATIIIW